MVKIGAFLRKSIMNSYHDSNWKGSSLAELYGCQTPWGVPEFPLIVPSSNHTVLYHIPSNGSISVDRPPKPQTGRDVWDHNFVRMPCSTNSLYPIIDEVTGETQLKKRWHIIQNSLSKPIHNSKELANAILSYNTKFKNIWKFPALHKLFNKYIKEEEADYFFNVTLPEIVQLALALPKLVQIPIPLLRQHKNQSISLSQQQISSLLANAFFCTFPRRNSTKKASEYASYPHINFNILYNCQGSDEIMEKLKSICHYFRRVCTKVPVGVVTFSRRSVPPRSCPDWMHSERQVTALPLHVDSANTIEDAYGLIQVDFANKYLGGGVLGYGCVQEEIRFVISPELLITMLFTEELRHNEALMIIGSERYSQYNGYGSSFQWVDDFIDDTPHDSAGRRRCAVLAIDALPYRNTQLQYCKEAITRDLNKAWVGFSFYSDRSNDESIRYPGVATGNWGCGAFGGSPQLKSLIQLMACAQARRPMAYYTFQDPELRDEIVNTYNMLARFNVTVGQLYRYLMKFCTIDVCRTELPAFLYQTLIDDEQKPSNDGQHKNIETVNASSDTLHQVSNEGSSNNNSPDLFSPDNSEEIINETETVINELKLDAERLAESELSESDMSESLISNERYDTPKEHKILPGKYVSKCNIEVDDCEMDIYHDTTSTMASNQTVRLFEEMQKFDEDNGRLNLSVSYPSINQNGRASSSNALMECNENMEGLSGEAKKRINKKITDYFSKRRI